MAIIGTNSYGRWATVWAWSWWYYKVVSIEMRIHNKENHGVYKDSCWVFRVYDQANLSQQHQSDINMLFNNVFATTALFAAQAAAHGAVTSYQIAGTTYPGYTLVPLLTAS
jgi:hypothetical protein